MVSSNPQSYMLVDQHDANIFALRRELVENGLDRRGFRLAINDEKVLFRIGARRDMLARSYYQQTLIANLGGQANEVKSRQGEATHDVHRSQRGAFQ